MATGGKEGDGDYLRIKVDPKTGRVRSREVVQPPPPEPPRKQRSSG